MSDYKRLVSYMYSYENGQKKNNIGHVKIETRGSQSKINLHLQSSVVSNKLLKAYMYYRNGDKFGCAYLGSILMKNNFGELKVKTSALDIMNSTIPIDLMEAVIVYQNYDVYFGAQLVDGAIISDEIIEFIEFPDSFYSIKSKESIGNVNPVDLLEASMLDDIEKYPSEKKDLQIIEEEESIVPVLVSEPKEDRLEDMLYLSGTEPKRDMGDYLATLLRKGGKKDDVNSEPVTLSETQEIDHLYKAYNNAFDMEITEQSLEEDSLNEYRYIQYEEKDLNQDMIIVEDELMGQDGSLEQAPLLHVIDYAFNEDMVGQEAVQQQLKEETEEMIEEEVEVKSEEKIDEEIEVKIEEKVEEEAEVKSEEKTDEVIEVKIEEKVNEKEVSQLLFSEDRNDFEDSNELFAESIEKDIEEKIENDIEKITKENTKESMKENGAENAETYLDKNLEDGIEKMIGNSIENGVEDSIENSTENTLGNYIEDNIEENSDDSIAVDLEHQGFLNKVLNERPLSTTEVEEKVNLFEVHPIAKKMFTLFPKIYPFEDTEITDCVKIEPQDIGLLPIDAWVLGSNSFLLHGYYSFQHLIFGKINKPSGYMYILGVPGIYHNRESFMARMFGFEHFKCTKRIEQKIGEFGYWYIPIILR